MSVPSSGSDSLDTLGDQSQAEEEQQVGGDADQLDQSQTQDDEGEQDSDAATLPDDPEELKKLLLTERQRRTNAQQVVGRQGDELGQYRAMFDQMLGGGAGGPTPPAGRPGLTPPGVGGAGPQLPTALPADPYTQAMQAATAEYHTLVNQGHDPAACYQHYQQRTAAAHQAEMDRRMFAFANNLQNRQVQFAQFEQHFFSIHPELADARVRRQFQLELRQASASGMYQNPVDLYNAAQQAAVTFFTDMGYEMVEAHEATKGRAKGLAQPGPRGARPGQPAVSAAKVIQDLNAAAAATHEAGQARLRRSAVASQKQS